MKYHDEAESILDLEIGCPYKRAKALMFRCVTMVRYERFEGLRQILIPNIRVV